MGEETMSAPYRKKHGATFPSVAALRSKRASWPSSARHARKSSNETLQKLLHDTDLMEGAADENRSSPCGGGATMLTGPTN